MDVVRTRRRPSAARAVLTILAGLLVIGGLVWSLPTLLGRRAASGPSVPLGSLVIDTVRRGALERDVTAGGTFAPDRVRIVANISDGVVASVPVRPGTRVSPDTVVAQLQNPDLVVAVVNASAQLAAALAEVRSARETAAGTYLDEESALRTARAESSRAAITASSYTQLHANGLVGDLQYRSAIIDRSEKHDLVTIASSQVSVGAASAAAKIAAADALVDQLTAVLAAKRAQLAMLTIRAGAAGIVQSVAVDPGQRVAAGTELARIAEERDLKAVLQVAESDVRGVAPGLVVRLTASDGNVIRGRVSRIAPAAQNGTVAVDVALDRIPHDARPDQTLDGTIVISRAPDALSIARPAAAGDGAHIALYRLDRSETLAYRTYVTLAGGSNDRARVVAGLAAGDRVIVSDTSAFTAPVLRIAN